VADAPDLGHLRRLFRVSLLGRSPLARYRPSAERRRTCGSLLLHDDGQTGADGNYALVFADVPLERVFAAARAHFGALGGYAVVVEVEAAPATDAALRRQGWRLDEEEPALVLTPLPAAVPAPPCELDIRPVADEAGLDAFFDVSRSGRQWVPSLAAARDPDVALLVGYVGGRAVATARIACVAAGRTRVADITGVATLPAYRRRGFGTAMTWAAVAAAAGRACDAAVLNASELGYPVYIKMGFVPVSTYRTYLPPDLSARQ
jgi:ribosomal protein S18 acetylase RimI-like enzyme